MQSEKTQHIARSQESQTEETYGEILAGFPGTRILILGDVMLDEYIWGSVRRISPEAPVPVVEAARRTFSPGGAANVASNIVGLSGHSLLGGVTGADASSIHLKDVLQEYGVRVDGMMTDPERPTTTKTRIVAHSQQIVRVDTENHNALSEPLENALLEWAEAQMPEVGCCILSDYSKGLVSPGLAQRFIGLARTQGKPVVVDPKGTDYVKYRGATVITPNVLEAEKATGQEIHTEVDVLKVGQKLLQILDGGSVLLTRGAEGMTVFTADGTPVHIPTAAQSVYDVTGAGDTVVSTLALALAVGASLEKAARLANRAAGIVVGKLGAARTSLQELEADGLADPEPRALVAPSLLPQYV